MSVRRRHDLQTLKKMLLLLLLFLYSQPLRGELEGKCLRKVPPPGELVLSTGSNVVLTCSGKVKVNGVKVNVSHYERPAPTTRSQTHNSTSRSTTATVGSRRRLSITTQKMKTGGILDAGRGETGAVDSGSQWKRNGKTMGTEKTEGVKDDGSSLVLSSVRATDSGIYICHRAGKQLFAVKVTIADPPETPTLTCHKRSPSSRIRCEWSPQSRSSVRPDCSILVKKSESPAFQSHRCSYWAKTSRCGCALDHNEDDLRVLHYAYLCVSSPVANVTSAILPFTPFSILKPDPPSSVKAQPEESHPTRIKVSWGFPVSWKSQDNYYDLIYEVKYHPEKASHSHGQVALVKEKRSYTIMDAIPGVVYRIQVRAKDEYDGHWSGWSFPIYASSWKELPDSNGYDDLFSSTVVPTYEYEGGSGATEDAIDELLESDSSPVKVSHHIVWISVSFLVLSLVVVAYMFRNRQRFLSKLQSLAGLRQSGGSSRPPETPKEDTPVTTLTFNDPHMDEEEDDEEQTTNEGTETVHFNNTSYFMIQTD